MRQLRNEEGYVIITALLILMLLTITGISAIRTSTTELKISTNMLIHKMNFYGAESGLAHGAVWCNDEILPTDDVDFDVDEPIPSVSGAFSNLVSYTGDIEYMSRYEPTSMMPDVRIIGEGTHPRGGLARVEGTFTWEVAFMFPEVALWVGGDLESADNANAVDGVYVEEGITYDIMVEGDHSEYTGDGSIAPNAMMIWISDKLMSRPHETFVAGTDYGGDGDMRFVVAEGNTSIGNETGAGLLYVKGDLTINGEFDWHGVIYVEGSVMYNGGGSNDCNDKSSSVWGSLIATGSVNMQNGDVCYEGTYLKELLDMLSGYRLTTWKQL